MTITVTHATSVVVADDGVSPIGSDEWNAPHSVVVNLALGDLPSGAANTVLWSAGSAPAVWTATPTIGSVTFTAGTTSVAPINLAAGTNLTTALAGALEYDGNELFFSPAASDRRAIPTIAYIRQHATYTLVSQTGAQPLFNGSANGRITLPVGSYEFEALVALASMSATSGNAEFLIGAGTATIANALQLWTAIDAAATGAGGVAFQSGYALAANPGLSPTNMATAATTTAMVFWVRGSFEVTVAGTVIPQIALTTAAAAVVQIGSFFKCVRLGAAADVALGNWS